MKQAITLLDVYKRQPLTDGVYKIHIPPMQQADRLEFFAGDVVRRLKIIPKARPSLLRCV